MKVVRNNILNNLYHHDKLPILYCSLSGSLQIWPNSQIWWFLKSDTVISNDTVQCFGMSQKKIVFWSALDAPSEKTVHLQELVMIVNVIVNNIVDIIHFDQNTVRLNAEELCKVYKIMESNIFTVPWSDALLPALGWTAAQPRDAPGPGHHPQGPCCGEIAFSCEV